MHVKLHANARTTPRIRAEIQARAKTTPVAVLAAEYGVNACTIRRWKDRHTVLDRSHRSHKLAIALTPTEEALVVELRTTLDLPLDDIVEVMRRCANAGLSRSGIHRCLQRHGVAARAKPPTGTTQGGRFAAEQVGFIHVDLKHLTRLEGRPAFVFVAIDRATRFVHIEIAARRDAPTIAACFERFLAVFPHKVRVVLTDNGSEFTDRFGAARWGKGTTGTGRPIACAPDTTSSIASPAPSGPRPTAWSSASTDASQRPSPTSPASPKTRARTNS